MTHPHTIRALQTAVKVGAIRGSREHLELEEALERELVETSQAVNVIRLLLEDGDNELVKQMANTLLAQYATVGVV